MYQFSTRTRPASILQDTGLIGKRVVVDTELFGQQVGVILRVCNANPFYGQTGAVAYIVSEDAKGWTDYQQINNLLFIEDACDCTDCGRQTALTQQCPECGMCLSCCDCSTQDTDELVEDYGDYQPPRMYWSVGGFWL